MTPDSRPEQLTDAVDAILSQGRASASDAAGSESGAEAVHDEASVLAEAFSELRTAYDEVDAPFVFDPRLSERSRRRVMVRVWRAAGATLAAAAAVALVVFSANGVRRLGVAARETRLRRTEIGNACRRAEVQSVSIRAFAGRSGCPYAAAGDRDVRFFGLRQSRCGRPATIATSGYFDGEFHEAQDGQVFDDWRDGCRAFKFPKVAQHVFQTKEKIP